MTEKSMVEKVARALADRRGGIFPTPWEDLPVTRKMMFLVDARAAIGALDHRGCVWTEGEMNTLRKRYSEANEKHGHSESLTAAFNALIRFYLSDEALKG